MSARLQSTAEPPPLQVLTGPQRAAALLMLLGDEHGRAVWAELSDMEVKQVCLAMADLGSIRPDTVVELMEDFMASVEGASPLDGSLQAAEELLAKVFPADRVSTIMSEVKGAGGRQVWRRLAAVPPDALATFLRSEYPQTVAVILSRLPSEAGGKVLALLPDALAVETIDRMLGLGDVASDAIENIEEMLHREFLQSGPKPVRRDPYEAMADRFNAFDRQTEARFLALVERRNLDTAQRIRAKMFTFEDVLKLDAAGIQTLMRVVDKDVLARALKGAPAEAVDFFKANMSSRAAKNFQDELDTMAPLRAREVDEAQSRITQGAKALADSGEIRINKAGADEDMV